MFHYLIIKCTNIPVHRKRWNSDAPTHYSVHGHNARLSQPLLSSDVGGKARLKSNTALDEASHCSEGKKTMLQFVTCTCVSNVYYSIIISLTTDTVCFFDTADI